jgi:hypothetical protein
VRQFPVLLLPHLCFGVCPFFVIAHREAALFPRQQQPDLSFFFLPLTFSSLSHTRFFAHRHQHPLPIPTPTPTRPPPTTSQHAFDRSRRRLHGWRRRRHQCPISGQQCWYAQFSSPARSRSTTNMIRQPSLPAPPPRLMSNSCQPVPRPRPSTPPLR